MNTLEELFMKIEEKRAESRIIPENADPRTRAGVEAIVRNALQEVKPLEMQYKTAVMSSVLIIGVNGPGAREFADISREKFNTLSVDFKLAKERLVKNLTARRADGPYSTNSHFMLLDELQQLRLEYDFVRLPPPQISGYNDGIYDAPLAVAVDKLIDKNYNVTLYSAITRREIGKQALASGFVGKYLPVVVFNLAGTVDTDFLTNPVTTLTIDGNVNDKMVKKTLSEIKAMVLGKTSKQTDLIVGQQTEDENE